MPTENIDKQTEEAWLLRLSDLQFAYSESLRLLQLCEQESYHKGIADTCKTLGYCYWRFSDFSLSLTYSLRALEIYKKIGDLIGEGDALNNIGAVYMFQNDNEKRLEVNLKCKEIRMIAGDLEGVASSEGNIGETYLEMGEYDNAETCFHNVLKDKNASPQGISWAYYNLGRIREIKDQFDEAHQFYKEALDLSSNVNYEVLITDSLLSIVELSMKQGNNDEALRKAENSLNIARKIGAKEGEKKSLFYLSKIYESKGDFKTSLKYHKDFHTLDLEISKDREIERLKTMQLKVAFQKIEEQKKELIDSIRYAEQIQTAVLQRDQNQRLLTGYFVLYEPRDIVSGDFYWYFEKDDFFYICVADCTGHGVPGAFLTMLGTTFLSEIINQLNDPSPADILDMLRDQFVRSLHKSGEGLTTRDGMDVSLLRMNVHTKEATWAGAYNPIWVVRSKDGEPFQASGEIYTREGDTSILYELKGDKFPVGLTDRMLPFKDRKLKLELGDTVYMLTDGFADQFGGLRGKKFQSGNLKNTLLEIDQMSINEKGSHLATLFETWKGDRQQVDDVCILGINIIPPTLE